jgi:DNA polymerase
MRKGGVEKRDLPPSRFKKASMAIVPKREQQRFAEGPENAAVMLIGQNPGREEVAQNRPFVGRSGKYLDGVLQKKGIDRKQLYLTCVVKEPTPGNKKPSVEQIARWLPCLEKEIKKIQPRIIVLMGKIAWHTPRIQGVEYIETYHPAAAMRFPKIKQPFERDIETLRGCMQKMHLTREDDRHERTASRKPRHYRED